MNKKEIKIVVDELRANKRYGTDTNILDGCGLSDFPKRKMVRKEVIVDFLQYQCRYLNGGIDEEELSSNIETLKVKKVIMI
jgi:hypothetical protein